MRFLLTLSVASFIAELSGSETGSTEIPTNEEQSSKIPVADYIATPSTWDTNPNLNSLWTYHPVSYASQQDELFKQRKVYRHPYNAQTSITRLAKTLSLGFHPSFDKGHFEPFEKRPRPVTLVGIRKNGVFPRDQVPKEGDKSGEIAVLQSPYNDIGNIWADDFVKE